MLGCLGFGGGRRWQLMTIAVIATTRCRRLRGLSRTAPGPQGRWHRSTNLWKSLDSWAHAKQFAAVCRSHGGSSSGSSTSCGSGDSTMHRVICRNTLRTMTWSALIRCSVKTIAVGRRSVNDRVQLARVIATATRIQEVPPLRVDQFVDATKYSDSRYNLIHILAGSLLYNRSLLPCG